MGYILTWTDQFGGYGTISKDDTGPNVYSFTTKPDLSFDFDTLYYEDFAKRYLVNDADMDGSQQDECIEWVDDHVDAIAASPPPVIPATATQEELQSGNALEFLKATDWYLVRQAETGAAVPQGILNKRAEARLRVIDKHKLGVYSDHKTEAEGTTEDLDALLSLVGIS